MEGEMIPLFVEQASLFIFSRWIAHETITQQVLEIVLRVIVDHVVRGFVGNDDNITGINSEHIRILEANTCIYHSELWRQKWWNHRKNHSTPYIYYILIIFCLWNRFIPIKLLSLLSDILLIWYTYYVHCRLNLLKICQAILLAATIIFNSFTYIFISWSQIYFFVSKFLLQLLFYIFPLLPGKIMKLNENSIKIINVIFIIFF